MPTVPKYNDTMPRRAHNLALLGLTNAQIADALDVSAKVLGEWMHIHPEFKEAVTNGKANADAKVARALFHRACGYEHSAVDIRVVGGTIEQTPYVKKYPPDTTAAIFWLKNRQKGIWRDVYRQELSGPGGANLRGALAGLATEDLELAVKLGLAKRGELVSSDKNGDSTN